MAAMPHRKQQILLFETGLELAVHLAVEALIERGRYEDLLRQNGFYATLYNSQFAVS